MSDFNRRFTSYALIGVVIVVLMFVSNFAADEFSGNNIERKRTFQVGSVFVTMNTENMDNRQDGIFKFSDIVRNNVTMKNNYDEKIVVDYTQSNYLGMKLLSNTTKKFELDKNQEHSFSTQLTMDAIGNNHINHGFVVTNYSNPSQFLAWGGNADNIVVFSQEVYATAFIQSAVIRFAWALAIPFVIISTKHLVDIWYGT